MYNFIPGELYSYDFKYTPERFGIYMFLNRKHYKIGVKGYPLTLLSFLSPKGEIMKLDEKVTSVSAYNFKLVEYDTIE